MKPFLYLLFSLSTCMTGWAQCLSDFTKLLPESSPQSHDEYGYSVAIRGEYAVVGASRNDSLGYQSGLVYIYKNIGGIWTKQGVLSSDDPLYNQGFGRSVDMNDDYIVVGASAEENSDNLAGRVFVFKKPASGWTSVDPLAILEVEETSHFGWAVSINEDGSAIAASDINYLSAGPFGMLPSGAVFLFRKSAPEWTDLASYIRLDPDPAIRHWGFGTSLQFDGEYLFASAETYGDYQGGIYVYRNTASDWSSVQKLVVLHSEREPGYVSHFGESFSVVDDRLVTTGNSYQESLQVFVFEKGSEWSNETESYRIPLDEPNIRGAVPSGIVHNENYILVAAQMVFSNEKLFVLKKESGSFQVSPVVYDITAENISFGRFGGAMDMDDSNVIIGNPYDHYLNRSSGTAVIIPVGDGSWSPVDLHRIEDRPSNTNDFLYGYSVARSGDILFVGSPRDTEKEVAGAVYVYRQENAGWQKINKITPEAGVPLEQFFGSALAGNDSILVVKSSGDEGNIYVYKTNSHWSDFNLIQWIPSFSKDGKNYQISTYVALHGKWLAVAAHETPSATSSTLLLFEYVNDEFELKQILPFGRSIGHGIATRDISVSFHDQTMAVGCITSNPGGNLLQSFVFVLALNDVEVWDTVAIIPPTQLSTRGFGFAVALKEDHLFVSDPLRNVNSLQYAGAIDVYVKPSGGWSNLSPSYEPSTITATVPRAGDFFGYDFDVFDNILIVGAPQSEVLSNPLRENLNAGAAYVIQGIDFSWTQTNQLLRYEGEFHNGPDKFGISVVNNEKNFLIGACQENEGLGRYSGAVYSIDMPPSVKLMQPLCTSAAVTLLKGYPHGGTWSGPGITDAVQGIFDPAQAGVGEHLLSYETPNCLYTGKLLVKVFAPPTVAWAHASELVLCHGESRLLQVTAPAGVGYKWFYSAPEGNSFVVLNTIGPGYVADKPGKYFAQVDNGGCAINTAVLTLSSEDIAITFPTLPVLCEARAFQLTAYPSGGVWSGPSVTGSGLFSPGSNGDYQMTYTVTSASGCTFAAVTSVTVSVPFPAAIHATGDYCRDGMINLSADPINESWQYKWFNILPDAQGRELIGEGEGLFEIEVTTQGNYQIEYFDGECTAVSAVFSLIPQALQIQLLPQGDSAEVCYMNDYPLTISAFNSAVDYTWFYKELPEGGETVVERDVSTFAVNKGGYYSVEGHLGHCSYRTGWRHIAFSAPDSVFVPNIFTPNNDGRNDVFEVAAFNDWSGRGGIKIYDRLGKLVYETIGVLKWDGGDHASGIYYWLLTYPDCEHGPQKKKGWVQLMR